VKRTQTYSLLGTNIEIEEKYKGASVVFSGDYRVKSEGPLFMAPGFHDCHVHLLFGGHSLSGSSEFLFSSCVRCFVGVEVNANELLSQLSNYVMHKPKKKWLQELAHSLQSSTPVYGFKKVTGIMKTGEETCQPTN